MLTIILLIVVIGNQLTIYEMNNMLMCESIGQQIEALKPSAKWNCIENAR